MKYHVVDAVLCRQCRGLCCQAHPGAWSIPERFAFLFLDGPPATPEALADLLAGRGLVLRDFSGVAVPAPRSTNRGCIFHSIDGCLLPEHHRPDQCLALIPDLATLIDGECRCRLPGEFTYGVVRQRWQRWWSAASG